MLFVLLEARTPLKEDLKCVTVDSGLLCVMPILINILSVWLVTSLVLPEATVCSMH